MDNFIKSIDKEYKGDNIRFITLNQLSEKVSEHKTLKKANKQAQKDKSPCIVMQGMHKRLGWQAIRPFYFPQTESQ